MIGLRRKLRQMQEIAASLAMLTLFRSWRLGGQAGHERDEVATGSMSVCCVAGRGQWRGSL